MFTSRLPDFLARLDLPAAARALGETAVACIRHEMLTGYQQPVFLSGALYRDVSCILQGTTAAIGSTLPYASAVHDGSATSPARPYLADGILCHASDLQQAVAQALQSSHAQ